MELGAHDYVMKDNLSRLIPAVKRELKEAKERKARRLAEKSLIENFPREEIELTLSQVDSDKVQGFPYYGAMKKRVAELRQIERYNRETEQKWEDRMIGCISGLIVALVIILLKNYLFFF